MTIQGLVQEFSELQGYEELLRTAIILGWFDPYYLGGLGAEVDKFVQNLRLGKISQLAIKSHEADCRKRHLEKNPFGWRVVKELSKSSLAECEYILEHFEVGQVLREISGRTKDGDSEVVRKRLRVLARKLIVVSDSCLVKELKDFDQWMFRRIGKYSIQKLDQLFKEAAEAFREHEYLGIALQGQKTSGLLKTATCWLERRLSAGKPITEGRLLKGLLADSQLSRMVIQKRVLQAVDNHRSGKESGQDFPLTEEQKASFAGKRKGCKPFNALVEEIVQEHYEMLLVTLPSVFEELVSLEAQHLDAWKKTGEDNLVCFESKKQKGLVTIAALEPYNITRKHYNDSLHREKHGQRGEAVFAELVRRFFADQEVELYDCVQGSTLDMAGIDFILFARDRFGVERVIPFNVKSGSGKEFFEGLRMESLSKSPSLKEVSYANHQDNVRKGKISGDTSAFRFGDAEELVFTDRPVFFAVVGNHAADAKRLKQLLEGLHFKLEDINLQQLREWQNAAALMLNKLAKEAFDSLVTESRIASRKVRYACVPMSRQNVFAQLQCSDPEAAVAFLSSIGTFEFVSEGLKIMDRRFSTFMM